MRPVGLTRRTDHKIAAPGRHACIAYCLLFLTAPVHILVPPPYIVSSPVRTLERPRARCRLERMDLGFCGRGFGDAAAAAVAESGPLPALHTLRLAGAYRLGPDALLRAAAAAPHLAHLAVPACICLQARPRPSPRPLAPVHRPLLMLPGTCCRGCHACTAPGGHVPSKDMTEFHASCGSLCRERRALAWLRPRTCTVTM